MNSEFGISSANSPLARGTHREAFGSLRLFSHRNQPVGIVCNACNLDSFKYPKAFSFLAHVIGDSYRPRPRVREASQQKTLAGRDERHPKLSPDSGTFVWKMIVQKVNLTVVVRFYQKRVERLCFT
jgi:hypothetical protein